MCNSVYSSPMQRRVTALALAAAVGLAGAAGCKGKKQQVPKPAAGSGDQVGSGLPTRVGPASPGNGIAPATDPDPGYEARRAELLRRGNPEMMKDAPVMVTKAPDVDTARMIKPIGKDLLMVGSIKVDLARGRAEIPAKAAELQGDNAPLEYIGVTASGKAYESLLTVNTTAIELRLALSMMGFEGTIPDSKGDVAAPTVEDTVLVSAIVAGKERPISAYLVDRKTKKSPKDFPFQVVGFRPEDRDQALLTKDFFTLVARYLYAPLRYTLDAGNPYEGPDTGYTSNKKTMPPIGGDLTLVLTRRPEKVMTPTGMLPMSPDSADLPVPPLHQPTP